MPNNKKTTTKSETAKTKAPPKGNAKPKPAKGAKATKGAKAAPVKPAKAPKAAPTKAPIQGITAPALERIVKRAGIVRKEAAVYPVLRDRLSERVGIIMEDIKVYLEHSERRTVYAEDLQSALESQGIILAASLNENAKKTASLQSSTSRGKAGAKGAAKEKPEPADEDDDENEDKDKKRKTRFRPGIIARREVKNQMKNSDNLAIPKANFGRVVREAAGPDVRFAAGIIDLLQLCVEEDLISVCRNARACAEHASRQTLSPDDIALALRLRN